MELWLLLLSCVGLTVTITGSHIATPFRNLFPPPIGSRGVQEGEHRPSLLTCPLCTGFWVGLAHGVYSDAKLGADDPIGFRLGTVIMIAFAGSILSYVAGVWLHEHDR